MSQKFIPTKEQLYKLLSFLHNSNIEWHQISISRGKIVVKAEPPRGEIEIRILHILEDGRIDDDEFRELLQEFN